MLPFCRIRRKDKHAILFPLPLKGGGSRRWYTGVRQTGNMTRFARIRHGRGNYSYVEEIQESSGQARLLGLNRRRIQPNQVRRIGWPGMERTRTRGFSVIQMQSAGIPKPQNSSKPKGMSPPI